MTRDKTFPVLMNADWNEAIGTGCVTVEVPAQHLETTLYGVYVGAKVFVVETEEMVGTIGVVEEILHPDDVVYAVVRIVSK
jgi:hypothetical protein